MSAASAPDFSLAQARKIVSDLFEPNPAIYWTDFLLTWSAGVACFWLVRFPPLFSFGQIVLFFASAVLFFRAALFTHELAHLRSGQFTAFGVVWNFLCGIPFLIPSFTYHVHLEHHRRKYFGTRDDGEYLPLGTRGPREIFLYLAQIPFIPPLVLARFALLPPLTWLSPRARDWIYRRASSMIIDPTYIRPLPTKNVLRIFRLQEFGCFLFIWGAVASHFLIGRPPGFVIVQSYLTAVVVVAMNSIRTLGAHRYLSNGEEMTFIEQFLDTVNYPNRPWLTALWAPLGLEFHATHHLFPSMPYHNLREAHNRLMKELPPDSPYRLTNSESLPAALRALWRRSLAAAREQTVEPEA